MSYLDQVERVILIGIDGGGSYHNEDLTPAIFSFLRSGSHSDFAKAQIPSNSGENWGSILTGVTPQKHGVTNTNILEPYPENSQFPSIFKLMHQFNPATKMASFVSWNPINSGLIEESLPVIKYNATDTTLVQYIQHFLKEQGANMDFIFIQLSDLDYAGHIFGWESPEYWSQYNRTDAQFRQILTSIAENGLDSSTLVFITADHGGYGKKHGGQSFEETRVLWGVRGPDVLEQEFSSDSIRSMDTLPTILEALRFPIPSYFDGQSLSIFEKK